MNKTITLAQLTKLNACNSQVRLFKELFGNKVKLTEELCIKHSGDFDFDWAANKLFTAPAWAEYERVTAPALAEYERVRDTAWAEYKRVAAITFYRLYNGNN